ncbi:hypothetical protein PALB_35040 [Pseudoalteromonas luteoviolacea B = ATCC 29581]|nr:hypothetical protein PALB_35040 [Pseudoalteromonas luteoviolacea B = ATCC 29581]
MPTVGDLRLVSTLGISFVERITESSDSKICYEIVGRFVLKCHRGEITLNQKQNHTQIDYVISCQSPWFVPSVFVRWLIARDIKKGLDKLRKHYA